MMTGNTAIHIASQLQSGAPRKAAFLVAVPLRCLMASCNVTGRRSLDTATDQSKRRDQDTTQLRNTVTNDTAHTVPQGVVDKIRSLTNG